jgi:hypothetical protein
VERDCHEIRPSVDAISVAGTYFSRLTRWRTEWRSMTLANPRAAKVHVACWKKSQSSSNWRSGLLAVRRERQDGTARLPGKQKQVASENVEAGNLWFDEKL